MGSLDANGVWSYDGDDHVTPLAAFMNLGMNSASEAIADVRSDLTFPTSTASVTMNSGFTSATGTQWRKQGIGGFVMTSQLGSVASDTVIGSLGGVYRPQFTTYITLSVNANASAFIIVNPTTGAMTLYHYGANSGNYVRGSGSWPLP